MHRVDRSLVPGFLALAFAAAGWAQTPTPFGTIIDVSRVLTEVRAVDSRGDFVPGLAPEDFEVFLDGDRAEVASVLWVQSGAQAGAPDSPPAAASDAAATPKVPAQGRTIVIVFQVDFGLHVSRSVGIVRMAPRAAAFVRSLAPDDRVALLTYGSHLELVADFTRDHEALASMLTTSGILGKSSEPPVSSPPLLADHLDPEAGLSAYQMIDGLELLGRALQNIPGTKSLVCFGFGLGRDSTGPGIAKGEAYEQAMMTLSAARTSVFSLDITDADAHTLGFGLFKLSQDTGGFYIQTHVFPDIAIQRLARVISSYYELEIIPPPNLAENFKIKIKVNRPGITVYARQWNPSNSHR